MVLCNVAQFNQPEVSALDDFLKQGGGVVVFGGDQVIAENYNRLLYDDGKGLLPAAIGPSVGDAAKKESGLLLQSAGLSPPDRLGFPRRGRPRHGGADPGALLAIPQAAAQEAIPRPHVALAFNNGDPAVVEAQHASRDGGPGGDLGRYRLDDLADPQELRADHAKDRAAGLGRPAFGAQHSGRPAV